MIDKETKSKLQRLFGDNNAAVEPIINWHSEQDFKFEKAFKYTINELSFHPELLTEKKVDLLTNREFLQTYSIREKGLAAVPDDWINPGNLAINQAGLDELWSRPAVGRMRRMLAASVDEDDKKRLEKFKMSAGFSKKNANKTPEERKQSRLVRLQKSIDNQEVVLFLGRQDRVYKKLQNNLNEKYEGRFRFVSDHIWSGRGYTEPGVKCDDNRLSVLQAMETIRRLPELNLTGEAIKRRRIAFTLDGYDMKHGLSAIYSNPNFVARWRGTKVKGINELEFANTGLTDLELANLVRNREWFELTDFYRTAENGDSEALSKTQVAQHYGIKYIGDLMREKIVSS